MQSQYRDLFFVPSPVETIAANEQEYPIAIDALPHISAA